MEKEEKEEGNKIKSFGKLFLLLYSFIFSIEMIKRASTLLAPNIENLLSESLTPIKAVAVGWFTTSIFQSSSAVGSVAATFAGNNFLTVQEVVFILIGASIGTAITALIISLVTGAKKRRDFRHGFEIGLCYAIYGVLLGVLVFFMEYFFKVFSGLSLLSASALKQRIEFLHIPNFVGLITEPIINFLFENNSKFILLIFAFLILIFTLKYLGKAMIEVLGGEDKARGFIHKYFHSKYKAYLIGFVITAIVFSSSITIGLLVPLAVARLINLKKAIPFILGARLGTFTDIFLASIIIGKIPAIATSIAYLLFGVFGTIVFLPNTDILFKITKYTSKRLIHISRKKAFYVLIIFILIPLLIFIL